MLDDTHGYITFLHDITFLAVALEATKHGFTKLSIRASERLNKEIAIILSASRRVFHMRPRSDPELPLCTAGSLCLPFRSLRLPVVVRQDFTTAFAH